MRVRLHDDDVHSYDDVIGALAGLGLSVARARDLAGRVDREGDALLPLGDAQTALRAVHARGLLGAAVDDELLERELRAPNSRSGSRSWYGVRTRCDASWRTRSRRLYRFPTLRARPRYSSRRGSH